jgi:type IV secretion system protein VirB4
MITTPAKDELLNFKCEALTRKNIPYARLVDAETIETKSGHLLQVIKLKGLISETLDDSEIDQEKHIRNALFRSIADSSISIYFHTIRKKYSGQLTWEYESTFARELAKKWQEKMNAKQLYVNEHYITLVKKPPQGKIRGVADLFQSLSGSINQEARRIYRTRNLKDLNKAANRVLTSLKHCHAKKLSDIFDHNKRFYYSELLTFLGELINVEHRKLVVPRGDLATYLPFKRLFFDKLSGIIAFRGIEGRAQFAGMLSIKEYSSETIAGMLDHLLNVKAEMIITQSFTFMDRNLARKKIQERQRNFSQSDDSNQATVDSISNTLEELGSSTVSTGTHHLTILCKGDTKEELEKNISQLDAALNEIGILAVREDVGVKAAFFASLPANHAYIARPAPISTKNIASFASLHNYEMGKSDGNFWGEAVTILETISSTLFYFSFHVLDVGNTFLIGPMGSGKTLIEMFLLILSLKLKGRLIVLDKDRGCEIAIRVVGGNYSVMKAGQRTGFAPFQLDTEGNRHFFIALMRKIACTNHQTVSDEDVEKIKNCVDGAFLLPKEKRILRNIVPLLGMMKPGSIRAHFENWVNDGEYAWVFDNDVDTLSLDNDIIGLDMTNVLEDSFVSDVIYFYLFRCIEDKMDGTPTRIVVPEGWRPLQDDTFRNQIQEWSSTPRKKNAFLVLDTQSPSDIANSTIGSKIIQETVTQIYFSNPQAKYDEYVTQFGLSVKEWEIIRSLEKESRYFLIKQGRNSAVVRADLNDMEDEIAVLSGRTSTVNLLDKIRQEVGDAPEAWLPLFLKAVRDKRGIAV